MLRRVLNRLSRHNQPAEVTEPAADVVPNKLKPTFSFSAGYAASPELFGNLYVKLDGITGLASVFGDKVSYKVFTYVSEDSDSYLRFQQVGRDDEFRVQVFDYTGGIERPLVQMLVDCFHPDDQPTIKKVLTELTKYRQNWYDNGAPEKRNYDWGHKRSLELTPDMLHLESSLRALLEKLLKEAMPDTTAMADED